MKNYKIIYLPIEMKLREFESKVLLAGQLINNGFTVVIGQQWEMYNQINNFPPGVFLFKSHNKIHHPAMLAAKNYGHIVFALEEENIALGDEKSLFKNSPKDLYSCVDYVLTTGDFEKEFHNKNSLNKVKVFTTGNPRIDLLKNSFLNIFNEKIKAIKKEHGDYILINTNFTHSHALMGKDPNINKNIAIRAGFIDLEDPQSIKDYDDYVEWESECLSSTIKLIKNLASKFKNLKFIIRPHPAEVLELASQYYNDFDNIEVIREGNHIPWTLGSKLLIHTSCTTGLEAEIAGKKAISLIPYENWYSDQILSNKVNKVFFSVDSICEYASDFIEHFNVDAMKEDKKLFNLKYFIDNARENLAIEKISNLFDGFEYKKEGVRFNIAHPLDRAEFQVAKCTITKFELEKSMNLIFELFNQDSVKVNNFFIQEICDSLFLVSPPLKAG